MNLNKAIKLIPPVIAVLISTALNLSGALIFGEQAFGGKPGGVALVVSAAMLAEAMTVYVWMYKYSIAAKVAMSLVCIMFMSVKVSSEFTLADIEQMKDSTNTAASQDKRVASLHELSERYRTIMLTMIKNEAANKRFVDAQNALNVAMQKKAGKVTVLEATNECTTPAHPKDCAAIRNARLEFESASGTTLLSSDKITALQDDANKISAQNTDISGFLVQTKCFAFDQQPRFESKVDAKYLDLCLLFNQSLNLSSSVKKYIDTGTVDVHTPDNYQPSWAGASAAKAPEGFEYIVFMAEHALSNQLFLLIIVGLLALIEYAKASTLRDFFNGDKNKSCGDFHDGNSTDFLDMPIASNFVSAEGGVSSLKSDFNINDLANGLTPPNKAKRLSTKSEAISVVFGAVADNIKQRIDVSTRSIERRKIEIDEAIKLNKLKEGERAASERDRIIAKAVHAIESPAYSETQKQMASELAASMAKKGEEAALMAWADMSTYFRRLPLEAGMQVIRSGEGMAAFKGYKDDKRTERAKVYMGFFKKFSAGSSISVADIADIVMEVTGANGTYAARSTIVPTLTDLGFIIRQGQGKPMKMCSDEEAREIWRDKIKLVVGEVE